MKTSTATQNGIVILQVDGDWPSDFKSSQIVLDEFNKNISEGHRDFVLDMHLINRLGSEGIGTLIRVYSRLAELKGQIVFCGMNERLAHTIIISKLTLIFNTFETVESALSHLTAKRANKSSQN